MGRLVDDVEVKYLPSGACAIKLRVVTDDGYYDTKAKPPEYKKRPTYHTVKQIGKNAEKSIGLVKGDWVFVEGSRLTDDWVDRDNNKKYADFLKAYIIVEIPDPFEAMEAAKPVTQPATQPESTHPAAGQEPDDDIPF
jgi:single-stranded DNA-binding protein